MIAAGAAACTGDDSPSAEPSPSTSVGDSATIEPAPVPMVVRVTRVHGKLKDKDARSLEANVGKVVKTYLDDAFLAGDYPRTDFSDAFGTFSSGVRSQAKKDKWLLTNSSYGASTTSVTAKETSAYLSVLAPYKVAAGVTARVTVRYVVDRGDEPAKQVTVTGRLMLTHKDSGWKIFGYDLARSVTTVGEGS